MKKVYVYSKANFPKGVDLFKHGNTAFISIEATDECAKYYLKESNTHYLSDAENVFNIEFDDLGEDRVWKGHLFRTITEEQAEKMLEFIESHLGADFVIHCKAGMSRSQAVYRFISETYPEYENCEANPENPCQTPNMEVVRKLKKAYVKKHGSAFGEIDG